MVAVSNGESNEWMTGARPLGEAAAWVDEQDGTGMLSP
jgi:hypothetical protein